MDIKLFKAFTPHVNRALHAVRLDALNAAVAEWPAADPAGSSWRYMGFAEVSPNEHVIDVQGVAKLCLVQLNERILPGAVLREKVAERAASIMEREGRKAGKKEWAQIRDEVEFELLPTAFIRRKLIPVMFVSEMVLIFTSSSKVCDDVVTLLLRATNNGQESLVLHRVADLVQNDIGGALRALAVDGENADAEENRFLAVGSTITLRGADKQQITVKDKDVASHDVSQLLAQDYSVTKLGVDMLTPGETDPEATFVLSDKLVFTGFKTAGVTSSREKGDEAIAAAFFSTAWLTAQTAYAAVDTTIALMGGLTPAEAPKTAPAGSDDDL